MTVLRLRRAGQRFTTQRRALVEMLGSADRPLTIPEIMKAKKGLALSSVYRNLAVLEQATVVHRIVTRGDYAAFELAEDLGEHHHHLICTSCGTVEDFTASAQLERSATAALDKVAGRAGWRVTSHRLDLTGLCPACR